MKNYPKKKKNFLIPFYDHQKIIQRRKYFDAIFHKDLWLKHFVSHIIVIIIIVRFETP